MDPRNPRNGGERRMKPARSKQSSPAPRGSRERREKGEVKNYNKMGGEERGGW